MEGEHAALIRATCSAMGEHSYECLPQEEV